METQRPSWVDRTIHPNILAIPPYIPGKPIAELERELGVPNAVKMASNENPLGPSRLALDAIARHVAQAHVYPESSAPELRAALAARFGVHEEGVILGNGSDELMGMAAHVFMSPGCEAVMGENTFSMYRICVEAFGGKPVSVKLKNYGFDLAAMAAAVTDKTRLMFLANPNSPTGTIVSRADFEAFLGDLPRERLVLVVDEAYREYVCDADCPEGLDYLGKGVPLLVLRTFSKIYGLAGLRVGYGFAEPWLAELLNRVRPPFNVNSLAQVAALAALRDVDHLERSRRTTSQGLAYLAGQLTVLGLKVIPSHANFIAFCWDRDAKPVYEGLLKEGVIVRHLASFGMPSCIRVTVGTESENVRFIEALKRVLSVLEAW
jgi:histidinol-phosphate aminotransferase